jgi:hypothetical protein
MIEEPANILYCFPCVPAQLGGGVAEDVDARRGNSNLTKISLKVAVEGATREPFAIIRV